MIAVKKRLSPIAGGSESAHVCKGLLISEKGSTDTLPLYPQNFSAARQITLFTSSVTGTGINSNACTMTVPDSGCCISGWIKDISNGSAVKQQKR